MNTLYKSLTSIRNVYDEYPRQFWTLILGVFIDRLGGALMFPFLTLYITQKFSVGMTEVGLIFGLVSISGIVGSVLGGALTDRFGRKGMLIFGLLVSAFINLMIGLVNSIGLIYVGALFIGLFGNAGGPAQQAMVADLLPEKKRAQGFGLLRVVVNLAVVIGPAIGGLLAAQSYLLLFICDAVASTITAGIVALAIRETKPAPREGELEQTMTQTLGGYRDVLRDGAFVLFIGACILMTAVYMQMNTTLSVYLRDVHGVSEQGFGYILSLNAAMVVLFQFYVTRRIARYRPLTVMAVGTLLYAIGFGMYGFVSTYALFLAAMVIITMGELLTAPTSQALVAELAPEDMRGRYMAVFGFSWVIPSAVGPLLAGLVMDNFDPRWVWYAGGLLGLVAARSFALLQRRLEPRGAQEISRDLTMDERTVKRPDYGNWVSTKLLYVPGAISGLFLVLSLAFPISIVGAVLFFLPFVYFAYARYEFSSNGGSIQSQVRDLVLDHLAWNSKGAVLDIGCGNGPLAIEAASRYPDARVVGIDYWGGLWEYSKKVCQRNAEIEGVAERVTFQRASASALPFQDGFFDAAVSNFVFHEVKDAPDKKLVVREALRVVKKGGRFAFQDLFLLQNVYGEIGTLLETIRGWGVEEVAFVDTSNSDFIPQALKLPMMLGRIGIIYGKK